MEKHTEVYYWGSDSTGEFGIGEKSIGNVYSSPRCCSFSVQIVKISCGDSHSGFIAANGYVYMMGSNQFGKLGIGNLTQKCAARPILIESLTGLEVLDISCGYQHTGIIASNNRIFTWGQGSYGQLGAGEIDLSASPLQLELPYPALALSCGGRHSVAILNTANKNLCVWGSGDSGQLGTGSREFIKSPMILNISKVSQIACGASHTLVLLENNELLASGSNTLGQLGTGNKESSSSFVKVPTAKNKSIEKIVAGLFSAFVTADGEIWVWGDSFGESSGEKRLPRRLDCSQRFVSFSLGSEFGVAIDVNGSVWSWGSGNSGCLGTGSFETSGRLEPISSLQGKTVASISAGSNFVIGLGSNVDKFQQGRMKTNKDNQELLLCLEEMKKEISRLQRGTGGLEDLNCKLEQSKIKQRHLQSLYLDEQNHKNMIEGNLKDTVAERDKLSLKLREITELYREATERVKIVEESLMTKEKEGNDLLVKLNVAEERIRNLIEDNKEVNVLIAKIEGIEARLADSEAEKNKINGKLIQTLEENAKISQKSDRLQEEINFKNKEIFELSAKCEELKSEKLKNVELQQTNYQLTKKIDNLQSDFIKKNENYNENLNYLRKDIEELNREAKEKAHLIEKLKEELQTTQANLESSSVERIKLEKKLTHQKTMNKDIIDGIQKELSSRAESIKKLGYPKKTSTDFNHTFDTFRKTD